MGNTFAHLALIAWPFISLIFYKKMPVVNATFWTIVGGYLVLPTKVAIDFPLIPPLDKGSIPAIAAMVGCIFIKKQKMSFIPKKGVEKWLLIVFLLVPFITVLNNQETYNYISGLTFKDGISQTIGQYLKILPIIIALQIVRTYDDQIVIFKLLVLSSLFYSLLILFEIRISPQLHGWIYGFFPHSFGQQFRFGGFRAVVFLGHGLLISMYIAIALGAAVILAKQKIKVTRFSPWAIVFFLLLVLLLNKTVSGFILGVVLFSMIAFTSEKRIRQVALALMGIVILYPALSILGIFPHQQLIDLASNFSPERGASLAYRFHYENLLLEHARDKLFFGWGGWSRNRIAGAAKDGFWIGIFGVNGLVGFVTLFGLAVVSVFRTSRSCKLLKSKSGKMVLASHALIISIIMLDQIPNSSFNSLAAFLLGALLGRTNSLKLESKLLKIKSSSKNFPETKVK